jgi:RNA polymerase sigma-70 factor (ECF subfamily)
MLGSLQDAEDLVQETLLKAWQHLASFEGRASFKTWLYKIATNACLSSLEKRTRRSLPQIDFPGAIHQNFDTPEQADSLWVEPFPSAGYAPLETDPEARYLSRENIRLAFLVALQLLPARQRAVLILCDVLDWEAREVADLLDMTVAAVSSALFRARATLRKSYPESTSPGNDSLKGETVLEQTLQEKASATARKLLDQYVKAYETANVSQLVTLLKHDAKYHMPPAPIYFQGRTAIALFLANYVFNEESRQRWRVYPTEANLQPALAIYEYLETTGKYLPAGLTVLTLEGEEFGEVVFYQNPALFPFFNLPAELS